MANRTKRRPPAAGKGKKPGTLNGITRAAKEAFALAFEGMGGVPALTAWGKRNPRHFYALFARLIPAERADSPAAPLVNVNLLMSQHITTPEAAAEAYRALANDPTMDFDRLSFSPVPAPESSCLNKSATRGQAISPDPVGGEGPAVTEPGITPPATAPGAA